MKIPWRRTILSLAFVAALHRAAPRIGLGAYSAHSGSVKIQRSLMGTLWGIEVIDHGRPEEARQAIDSAYANCARIEDLMSEWKPESPISQVNAAAGLHPVEVPAELRELLQRSIRYSEITEGTFDVTWRGMGNIWHFDDTFAVPTAAAVANARKNIDYRAIRIEGNSVFLPAGRTSDSAALPKATPLTAQPAFSGRPDSPIHWSMAAATCSPPARETASPGISAFRTRAGNTARFWALPTFPDMALVTSGDYERFRIVNGVRYHHIIDPRTGWPATASISVSVLAKTAEEGVVLAKGIFILGPEKGLALARAEGVEALVIDPKLKQYLTEGFRRAYGP